jgi:hypothetical protein
MWSLAWTVYKVRFQFRKQTVEPIALEHNYLSAGYSSCVLSKRKKLSGSDFAM